MQDLIVSHTILHFYYHQSNKLYVINSFFSHFHSSSFSQIRTFSKTTSTAPIQSSKPASYSRNSIRRTATTSSLMTTKSLNIKNSTSRTTISSFRICKNKLVYKKSTRTSHLRSNRSTR